jgi:stage III sporulation protein AE
LKQRWIFSFFLLFMFLFTVSFPVYAEGGGTSQGLVDKAVQNLDTSGLDKFWRDLVEQYGTFMPVHDTPRLIDAIKAEGFTLQGVLTGLIKFFFHEVFVNSKLLGTILVLTVLAAILETIHSAFERQNVSKIAYAVIYMVLIVLAVQSFLTATGYAKNAIGNMVDFMMASIPMVLALLASLGSFHAVAMMHPLIVFTVDSIADLIYYFIFPLVFFSAVLTIVSTLSERYKVTELAGFLRTTAIGLLGLFFSVFLGVMSVQGAAGAIADGVSIRAAKYASSTFIPVVGKMFADAADTVVGASLLIKNSVGIAGMVILLLMAAFPAIKIISLAMIFNLSAAVMQPLGHSPIISCLSTIGKTLILVFAALATVGLMFFLAVTIIIISGNLTVMMR